MLDEVERAAILEKGQTYYTSLSPQDLVIRLQELGFQTLAVCGGATVYKLFAESGVVQEAWLTVEPVTFGEGIPLFGPKGLSPQIELQLLEEIPLSEKTTVNHYALQNKE